MLCLHKSNLDNVPNRWYISSAPRCDTISRPAQTVVMRLIDWPVPQENNGTRCRLQGKQPATIYFEGRAVPANGNGAPSSAASTELLATKTRPLLWRQILSQCEY